MLKCSWVHNSMIAGQPMFLSAMDGLMPWMDWYNRMYSNRSCKTVNPRISRFVVDLRERHLEYWTPYFEIHPRDRTQQQTLYLLPMPFFSAANKSACYMNLTQQTTGHFFASVRYHTLICGFQARLWGEGKENIWFGGVSTKPHLLHTCLKTRLSYNLFGTLYAIKSINPDTKLPRPHYACCWCHWYDSKTNVAQNAAGPSHGSLVWRNVPWLQKTYHLNWIQGSGSTSLHVQESVNVCHSKSLSLQSISLSTTIYKLASPAYCTRQGKTASTDKPTN